MFKKTLIAAAALATLTLGASAANAGYNISIGYGGYGGGFGYHGHHHGGCFTSTRPVTVRVWDEYSYGFVYRTVYRDFQVCY